MLHITDFLWNGVGLNQQWSEWDEDAIAWYSDLVDRSP